MKHFVFILFLFTSLGFSETEENELKIMDSGANRYAIDEIFEKDKDSLWFSDEVFIGKLLKKTHSDNIDYFMKNINNKEFILKAIGLNNYALQNVSERLKDDKEIVLKSVQQYVENLRYTSTRLKKDKSILIEKDTVLYYLGALEKNDAINTYNMEKHHSIIKNISPLLLDDEEIISKAVSVFGILLKYASIRLKKNKNIAKKAVFNDGLALQYVDRELREDKEIIILALKNNPKAHQYISHKMRNNKEVFKMLMNQNFNGYMQNKIKRKVKPLAWEIYDINETLALLYGKDRIYEKSDDIHIKLPTNTSEYMHASGSASSSISIRTNKKVKSISILQKKDGDRALTALYYPYGSTVNFQIPLKILNIALTMKIEGMKVVVITETEDKHLFINEYTIKYDYICMNGYGMDMYLDDLRTKLDVNFLKKKYKINKNGIGHLKFMILHPMVSYIEAKKLNVKVNFISHVQAHIKDKKLFDLYISEYIRKDPLIKMEFENMTLGENIDLSYSTINGDIVSKEVIARIAK